MSRRNPILEAITDPGKNFIAFFFIGVLLFNIFSDGISSLFWTTFGGWLQRRVGIQDQAVLQTWILLGLALLILLTIYFTNLAAAVRSLMRRLHLIDTAIPEDARVRPLTETCRGLVAIMSVSDDPPAEFAIRHHWNGGEHPCLEHCWLITTTSSLDYARKLHQRLISDPTLVNEGMAERVDFHFGDCSIPDIPQAGQSLSLTVEDETAQDPDAILHLVNNIYAHAEHLGLQENEVIVDFTGGTKPLGIGAVLACTSPERRLEYIAGRDNPQLLEITVDYRLQSTR